MRFNTVLENQVIGRKQEMCVACTSLRKPKDELTEAQLQLGFKALLAKSTTNSVSGSAFFSIPSNQPPWFDTGLDLRTGDQVSVFAAGQAILSRDLDLWFHPDMQLWYRIGETGKIFRGTRNSHTFAVKEPGRLFFGSYFPGEWSTRTGAVAVGTEAYRTMEGGIGVQVIRWSGDP
jgi:hypothetical protein